MSKEPELCPRTLALWCPGQPLPGVYCTYRYSGRIPCTGKIICYLCGRTKPQH